jgi:hypothetical protein
MVKVCIITYILTDEAKKIPNDQLEDRIRKEIEEKGLPWMAKIEKITVDTV